MEADLLRVSAENPPPYVGGYPLPGLLEQAQDNVTHSDHSLRFPSSEESFSLALLRSDGFGCEVVADAGSGVVGSDGRVRAANLASFAFSIGAAETEGSALAAVGKVSRSRILSLDGVASASQRR